MRNKAALALSAVVISLIASSHVQAQTIQFLGAGGNSSLLQPNGETAFIGGSSPVALLTTGNEPHATPADFVSSSVFTLNKYSVASFQTDFVFSTSPGTTSPPADGITFTVQNDGPGALGGPGSNLGYSGIASSVGVKFDIFQNTNLGDPSDTFTNMVTDGDPNNSGIDLTGAGFDFKSGRPIDVDMTYKGTTLHVQLRDTVTNASASQSYTVDIPSIIGSDTGYLGFTGATGYLNARQELQTWSYDVTNVTAVPEGGMLPYLLVGIGFTASLIRGRKQGRLARSR